MNRKILILFPIFLSLILSLSGCASIKEPISKSGFYFDTLITITLYDGTEEQLEECFSIASFYENLLSKTIEGSDIWKLNHAKGSPVTLHPETIALLNHAISYADISQGKIDPTIQAVTELWDFKNSVLPDKEIILSRLAHVDYKKLSLNSETMQAALTDPEAAVDLGFIAKGYIADKLKEYLEEQNVQSALINLGGNILTLGARPDGTAFRIGIQKPFENSGTPITTVSVQNQSVVSSGCYERYFEKNGKLYHHILDSHTGYPVENNLLQVTIISDSSMEGDALSTTCFVLGQEKGMELIESLEHIEAIFITDDYELHYSSGLSSSAKP